MICWYHQVSPASWPTISKLSSAVISAVMGKLSSAVKLTYHKQAVISCHISCYWQAVISCQADLQKPSCYPVISGKGDQIGRNSVLTTDGQTEGQVPLLSCVFATNLRASKTHILKSKKLSIKRGKMKKKQVPRSQACCQYLKWDEKSFILSICGNNGLNVK